MKKLQKPQKENKNHQKKLPDWFGPRTIGPICFHKDGVITQRKLMFKKVSCSQTQLVVHKCTLIYVFVAFWVLGKYHLIIMFIYLKTLHTGDTESLGIYG